MSKSKKSWIGVSMMNSYSLTFGLRSRLIALNSQKIKNIIVYLVLIVMILQSKMLWANCVKPPLKSKSQALDLINERKYLIEKVDSFIIKKWM